MAKSSRKTYRVKYQDKFTRKTKVKEVMADGADGARLSLAGDGRVISVKEVRSLRVKSKKFKMQDRFVFLMKVSVMASSRMPMGEALKLIEETFSGMISYVAGELKIKIDSGKLLVDGMDEMGPSIFPPNIVALIRAGTMGGDTGKALMDAALFEQELYDIKKESNKGIYPAMGGFFVAAGMIVSSTFYFSPMMKNSPIFNGIDLETKNYDIASYVLGYSMLAAMIIFSALILLNYLGKSINAEFADNMILKIPFYRDIVLARSSYTSLYGLSMLLSSGVRVAEALKVSYENTRKGALRSDLKGAYDALRQGEVKWPLKLKTLHPTDRATLAMALDQTQVADTMMNVAIQYRRLYSARLRALIPMLQLVAAFILVATAMIMTGQLVLPMLKITEI